MATLCSFRLEGERGWSTREVGKMGGWVDEEDGAGINEDGVESDGVIQEFEILVVLNLA